jgi:hypothetical protein
MKNYRESSPNRIDNVLCALIVAAVLGAVGYGAVLPFITSVSA